MRLCSNEEAGAETSTPTTGSVVDCCASAVSGHAVAPPSKVMNLRLLMPAPHTKQRWTGYQRALLRRNAYCGTRSLPGQESAGLAPFEDLVHIGSGAPSQISAVHSIGHKAPGIDKLPHIVHGRQPVLCRQVHEASSFIKE